MHSAYRKLFSTFLSSEFKKFGLSLEGKSDCPSRVSLALFYVLQGKEKEANQIINQTRNDCPDSEIILMEVKPLSLARVKGKGNKATENAIEEVLQKSPKAGFARALKVELLQQRQKNRLANQLALEILKDFPDAKWLNIFMVQTEIFSKNYSAAAKYAEELPRGITRTLNLFWAKFWYPRIWLTPLPLFITIFVLYGSLPTSLIYLVAGLAIGIGFYLFRTKKDGITFLWSFLFSVTLVVSGFFLD